MESVEVRKLKEKASKFIEKHKLKKALKVYLELLKLESRDASLHMKAADLQRRLGRKEDAIRLYARASELYAKDGMLIQGMAACKVILDIEPSHSGTQELLADLYTKKFGALPRKKGDRDSSLSDGVPTGMPEQRGSVEAMVATEGMAEDSAGIEVEVEVEFDVEAATKVEVGSEYLADENIEYEEEIELIFEDEIPTPSVDQLPQIPLFSELDRQSFIELLGRVPLRRYQSGAPIVSEGERGDSFFVLVSGSAKVVKDPGIEIAMLKPGAFFGEIALVTNRPRRASVEATSYCEALEIERTELDSLSERFPHIGEVLRRFAEQRLLHNLMLTSPLFTPFSDQEKCDLVRRFHPEYYVGNVELIAQGKQSPGLFLIASGAAEVQRRDETGALSTIATLSEGDICGELSLMTQEPAVATVRTLQECRVLKLQREAFGEIIMTHPQVLLLMSELSDTRRWEARESLSKPLMDTDEGGSALL